MLVLWLAFVSILLIYAVPGSCGLVEQYATMCEAE